MALMAALLMPAKGHAPQARIPQEGVAMDVRAIVVPIVVVDFQFQALALSELS